VTITFGKRHLVALLVVVLVGAGAFFIGRASADKSHSSGIPVVAVATTTTTAPALTVVPPAPLPPVTVTAAPTTTAPPTTSTPPATSPPTTARALPTVTVIRSGATWTGIEPSDVGGFTADGNYYMFGIVWSSWTSDEAVGHGTTFYRPSGCGYGGGCGYNEPATVTFFVPVDGHFTQAQFQDAQTTFLRGLPLTY
jgi:hypothetical protein